MPPLNPRQKTVELTRDEFRTVWYTGDHPDEIDVDVYHEEKLVLEWRYGKVCGNSLFGNAALWLDQALLQARGEMKKENLHATA